MFTGVMELKVIVRAYDCWGICSYLDPPFDVICVCLWRYSEYVHVRMLSPDTALMRSPPTPLSLLLSWRNDSFKNLPRMIIIDWLVSP